MNYRRKVSNNSIEDGVRDSVCRDCANLLFFDWYLCDLAPEGNVDNYGFLILPIRKCANYQII